jgi:aminocarboxymuconate-semialdehyde decarboxylase
VLGIDMHAHIVTPEVLELIEREGEHYQTRIVERDGRRMFMIAETATRPINERILALDDGAARVRDRDAEGIDREVLSCVPFLMYPDVEAQRALAVAQVHNDSVADLAKRRADRFVGWAAVPLQEPALAARELERARGLGLAGVMIPPSVRGQALDEDLFEPFWEAAAALDLPVFIHPFEARPSGLLARYNFGNLVGNLTDTGIAAAAIIAGGVLERHPRLRVILAHAGGTLPSMIGRIDNGFDRAQDMQARLSRRPASYLNQLWLDTIAYNPPHLKSLITQLGADRFVIGSDYPVGGPPHPAADVRALGLSEDDEAQVLRRTAESLLSPSSPSG